ncbi:MAG: LuxR C-terminal-related transcriptional regulator [Symbiobacteriia bacterium]
MEPITVLVLDPMLLVAQGIAGLLASQPAFKVVGSACTVAKASDLVEHYRPHLVLTETRLADGDATQLIEAVKKLSPHSRVIILTSSTQDADIMRVLRCGAQGYLLKAASLDQIARDLRLAARGEPVLAGAAAMAVLLNMAQGNAQTSAMTPREQEVLALLAGGLSNRDLAQALQLKESTVKRHVGAILEKLGLNNRAEAAAFAVSQGLAVPRGVRQGWLEHGIPAQS